MKKVIVISIVLFCASGVFGQATQEDVQNKIKQLEAQLQQMQAELEKLKKATELPAPVAKVETTKPETKPDAKAEKKGDLDKRPIGVDLGNGVRVTPYGTIFFNAFGNSGGTNNADVPIFATPTGSGNVSASVRQTRLGIKLEGAKVGKARIGAVVEGDFFGGFPSINIGENFGVFRIRLAYAKLDWKRTSVTAGQDWMVFAPVNPVSLAAAGNPQMGASGNNWARLPQVKVERKLSDHVTWQGAVLEPQTGDFVNPSFTVQPTSGAASRVPFIQSRLAFSDKNWFGTKKPGTIGVSGHFGRSRLYAGPSNIRNDITSEAIALDWNFPIVKRISISGEAFTGRNLGGFQGGVAQSYNNDFAYRVGSTLVSGGVRSIRTRGGWTQIGITLPALRDRIGLYGSVGVDDPFDKDLVSLTHRDWRKRNLAFAADIIYKLTPQFSVGAEFRRFQTNYFFSNRQSANHVNLGAAYTF